MYVSLRLNIEKGDPDLVGRRYAAYNKTLYILSSLIYNENKKWRM